MFIEAYIMNKMVRYIGCPTNPWAKHRTLQEKSGQLMTHHSGQIPSRQGTCTRIEECRHTDTHHLHNL